MEKLLMLPVPATTAMPQECEEVQKKNCHPNPVPLKKSRRVLFEPLASDGEQETEGKWAHNGSDGVAESKLLTVIGEGVDHSIVFAHGEVFTLQCMAKLRLILMNQLFFHLAHLSEMMQ